MGSKNRHSKEILSVIPYREDGQWWVEPFVGGANLIDKVGGNRLGSDSHSYLISLWKSVSNGWTPPEKITEDEYNHIKNNKSIYPSELVGYIGFALSYGGKWWGGWRRDVSGKRDYVAEAYRNSEKQFPLLKGVKFVCCEYDELTIPTNSLIYCDPPYRNTTAYSSKLKFNHDKFYDWCRKMKCDGHTIFVSEYNMPEDFKCVWQKDVCSSLTSATGSKKNVEKLFTL